MAERASDVAPPFGLREQLQISLLASRNDEQAHESLFVLSLDCSRDLLFQSSEEVEGFDGGELVEVGGAEFVEDFAVEGREEDFLMGGTARRAVGCGGCGFRCAVYVVRD